MSKLQMNILPSLLLAALASSAWGQQVIAVGNIAQVKATVSLREPNVLAVEGRKLVDLKGWNDELTLQLDDTNGRATFFVTEPARGKAKSLTLQASDDAGGTYVFNLSPLDIPGELIILRPQGGGTSSKPTAMSGDYQRAIKNLMLVMARGDTDAESTAVNKAVPLWNEARFVLQRQYFDTDMMGERYFLTNVSGADMVLSEQEFYRPDVMAVAIETHNLTPGATTPVYIIKARKSHD